MSRKLPVRWVTLAEAVAIAAVAISGLGLYNSWSNRAEAPAPAAAPGAHPLTLRATASDEGRRLALAPARDGQVIQSQTIAFPKALGLSPVETTGDPRIEAGWLKDALKKAGGKAGAGDRRVPIAITTVYVENDATATDVAIYQLGYALEGGGLFGGTGLHLRGLSIVSRGVKDAPARLATMWKPAT